MLAQLKGAEIRPDAEAVLSGVDFHADDNDFIYVIGKVGSGKSSLLKTLYGEYPLAAGEGCVLDFDLAKLKRKRLPELRRQLGIVFQDFQLMQDQTVRQNLDFVLRATGWKKKLREGRIDEVLTLVGLPDRKESFPHELSGGEQQRVCIARALLNHPKLILADEPTGNLDVETSQKIMDLLFAIRDKGTAVVMVTHNLSLLSQYPGIVYRCADGRIEEVTEEYNAPVEM